MRSPARLLLGAVALAGGLAVPWIAGEAPQVVEHVYSRGLFPLLAGVLGFVGRAVPFSWAQIVVALGIVGVGFWLARSIRAFRRRRRGEVRAWFTHTLAGLAILVWTFQLLWGFNYSRPTLLDRLEFPAVDPDAARLSRLVRALVRETNLTYKAAVHSGEIVPAPESSSTRAALELSAQEEESIPHASHFTVSIPTILSKLEEGYRIIDPALAEVRFAAPKRPEPAGSLLTLFGISGIYFPFTGESNVNGRIPAVSLPFTAAHEMGHQRGIAREDEANLMAYLACRASGSNAARYSGALSALTRARGALWRTNPDSLQSAGPGLGPGPRADIETIRRFWARHEGPAAQVAERVNDSYLKANAQTAGVASYDRMIEILVALQEGGALDDQLPRASSP